MKYPWIDEYLLSKRGVTRDYQPVWKWIRYHRSQYEDIVPGYYSNKQYWNSVRPDGQVPDSLLKTLLDRSYYLVLCSLPKKKQREALGLSCCGTDCSSCPLHGQVCAGCNETDGKVFHMPEGTPCPIFSCCANRHHYATCSACGQAPCRIWRETRDPSMNDEAFEKSINDRLDTLKSI